MEVFERKAYSKLLDWKDRESGRSAALLEGARRTGKTTVAKQFAAREYRSHILIDFSNASAEIIETFERHSTDLDDFFLRLQQISKTALHKRDSAIIFDEVQLYPKARQMIKHLVADGRYDYLETGSLISIKKNVKDILIPSEETAIKMYPMDFEEFLWASGDRFTMDLIRRCFEAEEPLGNETHLRIMSQYRLYMILGGMPQVIDRYLKDKSLVNIEAVKRQIIDLYRNDMMKLPDTLSSKALGIFDSIPSFLSAKKKMFMPSRIKKNGRMREYTRALKWLSEAMIVNPCRQQTDPSVAIGLDIDESRVKPYLMDTGLMISLAFGNDKRMMNEVYDSLLMGKLSINEGMFFENMVSQELTSAGYKTIFCEFRIKSKTHSYEVDFLLPGLNKLSPVEVKPSVSSKHASLDNFCEKYGSRVERPIIIHSKDLRTSGRYLYIPIYMTALLRT